MFNQVLTTPITDMAAGTSGGVPSLRKDGPVIIVIIIQIEIHNF